MKNKTRNIFFAFGLVAVVIMLFTFKVSFVQLWRDITKAGYWLFAILGMWVGLYLMNALTWRIIIKGSGDCPVSFLRLFKLTVSGFALNYATPVGLMGGEPYKIMELSPYIGTRRATSSVVLFAMMHIFSHFWFWLSSIVVYVIFMGVDSKMAVILTLMSAFCLAGIYLFVKGYKNGMVVKFMTMLSHVPGLKKKVSAFVESHSGDLKKIDEQISELQGQNKRSFYLSFFLEFTGRILQSFEIYFMLQLFDMGTGFTAFVQSFLILAFTSLFANLLFFMPLQIGGREGGFAMSTAQMGMTNDIGMFISIICRVRELFWTAMGMLLMKVGNNRLPAAAENEVENERKNNQD